MKIKLECMYTGEKIEISNVYAFTSDDLGVKVFTNKDGNRDMTYYGTFFIISAEEEGI